MVSKSFFSLPSGSYRIFLRIATSPGLHCEKRKRNGVESGQISSDKQDVPLFFQLLTLAHIGAKLQRHYEPSHLVEEM